ncbi:MAG TPA: undecaprenyl-phosphate glucose phosphotransferase [Chloroflexi bacterium]|jgi:exopolysaccharide biosynthesis polyprenyl glycosylphosphotransferase|nr:undecaprenyl-phosphate glucose phosphotransferase [Chloroflexota bacterium]
MSKRARVLLSLLTVAVDAWMAVLALYLAHRLRAAVPIPTALVLGPFISYLDLVALQVLTLIPTMFFMRLYHRRRGGSRIDLFYAILSSVSIATVIATSLSYLTRQGDRELTRGLILYNWALTVLLVTLGRVLVGVLQRYVQSRNPDPMLLVGTGEVARMIHQKTIQSPHLGYRVIGFVNGDEGEGEIAGVPVLGSQSDLGRILAENDVEDVVIALPEATHDQLLDMISICETHHASVRIFPDLFQIIASELTIGDLDGLPLLAVRDVALRGWKLTLKRTMDIVVSAAGLTVLSPFMLLTALLIKLTSPGPVFYAQERVGLDGRPFPMLKFRSMRVDAESSTGPVWATPDDPRRTALGTFLRKTSIDELPQLINVLIGDMSLVGPRPERPVFVEQFKQVVPRYMERHQEKAGMTGWAQVNGLRGDTSIVERTKYDLYYIENWSLLFDIKILVRTILNAFRGDRNAY